MSSWQRRMLGVLLLGLLVAHGTLAAEQADGLFLDGRFGAATIPPSTAAVDALRLRRCDGSLEPQSLLSPVGLPWLRGAPDWGTQAYTYVVDTSGTRYESRHTPPRQIVQSHAEAALIGVTLRSGPEAEAVAEEVWRLIADGRELVWRIERRWLVDLASRIDGTPALFFTNRPHDAAESSVVPNSVSTTLWYDPGRMGAAFDPLYRPAYLVDVYRTSRHNSQWVQDPDSWAVLKLFTNWGNETDLRLSPRGGHLYRRGFYGWLSEAGVTASPGTSAYHRMGDTETIELRLSGLDRRATGYQLVTSIPDAKLEAALEGFYGRLLNGGVINDQAGYSFGNESDGWYYAGSSWMQGLALSVGVPAPGKVGEHTYDVATAFRGHLQRIMGTLRSDNRLQFGYNISAEFVDDNLHTIIGTRAYLVHTGDLAFVRQHIPYLERMARYFVQRRNQDGLYDLGPSGHWYYDAMPTSGVNTYHNAFLYKALCDLAEMERAVGRPEQAAPLEATAHELKAAINDHLWWEDAPGGPRYCDWITPEGRKIAYFADLCQWPAVALGIASEEQARKIIATADTRIVQLEQDHGYRGYASLSALWPVPDDINTLAWQKEFPIYMNGGSFLAQTYWEVVARARAGDSAGALHRLSMFAEGADRTSWLGNNWVEMDGHIGRGASDEPYLADMVVVPAALVHGLLGVQVGWNGVAVEPRLPHGWSSATAEVLHRGRRQRISITREGAQIEQGGIAYRPTRTLTFPLRGGLDPTWGMSVDRLFSSGDGWAASRSLDLNGGQALSLGRRIPDVGLMGRWLQEGQGDPLVDGGPFANRLSAVGEGVTLPVPGPSGVAHAAHFGGGGWLRAPADASLSFGPEESMTLECALQSESLNACVAVSRPLAYCLYIKDGRLAAWIMADGVVYAEALGSARVADGAWHNACAVFDREAQELRLYADGRLDTPDGGPSPTNPVSIDAVGVSTSAAPLCIGSLDGGFEFEGNIADVSVWRGAIPPDDPRRLTKPSGGQPRLHPTGWYRSAISDWGQPAQVTGLQSRSSLNGGRAVVIIEASNDGFATIASRRLLELGEGVQSHLIDSLGPARQARLHVRLQASADRSAGPVVTELGLSANLAGED